MVDIIAPPEERNPYIEISLIVGFFIFATVAVFHGAFENYYVSMIATLFSIFFVTMYLASKGIWGQ